MVIIKVQFTHAWKEMRWPTPLMYTNKRVIKATSKWAFTPSACFAKDHLLTYQQLVGRPRPNSQEQTAKEKTAHVRKLRVKLRRCQDLYFCRMQQARIDLTGLKAT